MIAIASERYAVDLVPNLVFRAATAEALAAERVPYDAVLAFNYLHLVRDLSGTLGSIHALLASSGLFISKTPCVGEMSPLIRLALLPAMRAFGKAPYAGTFGLIELSQEITAAGFESGHRKPRDQRQRQPSLYRCSQALRQAAAAWFVRLGQTQLP